MPNGPPEEGARASAGLDEGKVPGPGGPAFGMRLQRGVMVGSPISSLVPESKVPTNT